MNKETIKSLRVDINAALASVAEKYGMTIKAERAAYNDFSVSFKLECVENMNGEKMTKSEATLKRDFKLIVSTYDLPADFTEKVFTCAGKQFTVTGYDWKKYSRPFICQCLTDGKEYCFKPDVIRAYTRSAS